MYSTTTRPLRALRTYRRVKYRYDNVLLLADNHLRSTMKKKNGDNLLSLYENTTSLTKFPSRTTDFDTRDYPYTNLLAMKEGALLDIRKTSPDDSPINTFSAVAGDQVFRTLMPHISIVNYNTFVVWQDNGPGNDEIFIRKSANGGIAFGNTTNLSNNNASSISPQVASFGNNTFVVWQDNRTGNDEIFHQKECQWRYNVWKYN